MSTEMFSGEQGGQRCDSSQPDTVDHSVAFALRRRQAQAVADTCDVSWSPDSAGAWLSARRSSAVPREQREQSHELDAEPEELDDEAEARYHVSSLDAPASTRSSTAPNKSTRLSAARTIAMIVTTNPIVIKFSLYTSPS